MSEALKIDIDARSFQGLLKGLIRRTFFGETKYNNEFLKDNVMVNSKMTEAEVGVFFNDCLKILQLCAFNDATDEEFMKSFQEKFDCTEEHCKIAKLYWASEREKIHTTLCNDATWSTTLKNFSWRLDVTTTRNDTSSEPEFSAPVALVEMNTGKKNSNSVSSIKFQMSKTELNDLVLEVNKIQNLIQTYVENPEEDKEEA
jgi:hypothetical protein